LRSQGFKAGVGELITMPGLQLAADSIGIVGLGSRDDLDVAQLRRAAGSSSRHLSRHRTIATTLHSFVDGVDAETAVVEGMLLGSYHFDHYKTTPSRQDIEHISVLEASEAGVERGVIRATATTLARDLINEPASTLNPATLADRVQEIADQRGLACTVWDENELAERGFGGLLGVGKGSDNPPRLIQLRYAPEAPTGRVTLIGKGITFDSGGLSMKPPEAMEDMKTDMSGAAAVIGAMSALRDLEIEVEVSCIVPAAENMPSGKAIRPGDVIRHYGGKTSEVLNSDAEGRLVLADALALASEEKPDSIIDVATLTGSIVIALGLRAAGLFCEDESLRTTLLRAAGFAGERFWWMPIFADYRKQLNSEVADIKNIATKWGGSIFAANFLKEFVAPDIPWAHLDIAGGARAEEDYDEVRKGGTGLATRTLMTWLEQRSV
ncbi:MAG: leucyl aminopeptidase, partial [Actinomycetota bacterium]|nr:leucyl aminopeptidase [Actinomycetota bacterium]